MRKTTTINQSDYAQMKKKTMHYCLLSDFLESTEKCNPDEILTLIDSPVHDLICNRSLMEVRVGCPKSDKNCFSDVKKAVCSLAVPDELHKYNKSDFTFYSKRVKILGTNQLLVQFQRPPLGTSSLICRLDPKDCQQEKSE